MPISVVNLDDVGVAGPGTNGVDYLIDGDANDHVNTNRPMENLAYRDEVLRDAINTVIGDLNAAAGSAVDLATRLNLEHNPDGSHTGGAPHAAVTLPVGHPYLTLVGQQLNANVDNPAAPTGGSGLLVASDDPRLSGQDFALVAAPGGDYATPKAALDAGETRILIAPGTYDDTGAGSISISVGVVIIGTGEPTWQSDGVVLMPGSEGSVLDGIEYDVTGSFCLSISSDRCVARNTKISLTPSLDGSRGVSVFGDYCVVDGLDVSSLQNTAAYSVAGITVAGNYNVVNRVNAMCASVGDPGKYQAAIELGGGRGQFIHNVSVSYCTHVVYGNLGQLENVRIKKVVARNMALSDIGVTTPMFEIGNLSGAVIIPRFIRDLVIEDVDAGVGSGTYHVGSIAMIAAELVNPVDDVSGIRFRNVKASATNSGIIIGNATSCEIKDIEANDCTLWCPSAPLFMHLEPTGVLEGVRLVACGNMITPLSSLLGIIGGASTVKGVTVTGCVCKGRCISITSSGTDLIKFVSAVGNTIENSLDYAFHATGTYNSPFAILSGNVWRAPTGFFFGALWQDGGSNLQII